MTGTRTTVKKRSGTKPRERFPFLLFLSCLIHATLVILLAILFAKRMTESPKPKEEPPPPEVTLELPPQMKDRPFIEAKQPVDKAPENAPFQSDENTKAASELPPTGNLPLPTQQGVNQPAMELQNQHHTAGEIPASQAGNNAPAQPPSPESPAVPKTQAAQKPQDHAEKPSPTPVTSATPAPSSSPQAKPTPTPTPLTPPPPNNLKLLEPPQEQSKPADSKPQNPAQPSPQTPPSAARPPSQPGTQGSKKGYQPESRQTVIMGNISNKGRSSVAAEATPIGRYKKRMSDAIGSRWYYYVNERMGLLSIGTVNVAFKITSSGKVTGLHVISTNSNESLTDCSLRSIMDAKLPPIPPEVAQTLQDGSLEIEYSFTIFE